MKIGILALQGAYEAHARMINRLGHEPLLVRYPEQLPGLAGLIIPGGESTAMVVIGERIGMSEALRERAREGLPVFGTCAGMILLAEEVEGGPGMLSLGLLPIRVARNAFGRQTESFEADLRLSFDERPMRGVFIRAPRIRGLGDAEPIAWLGDEPVGVRKGSVMATSFHPELTDDTRLHGFFLEIIKVKNRK
ncbi:MAG: pyridoxal 5'-phosphate synthase glutaminase subunit PdxT [candidate division WOR-3 bacterium]